MARLPAKPNPRALVSTSMPDASTFESAIEEIASKMKPDMIFLSAGFDAHLNDPLGQLQLEDPDFRLMTRAVKQWADEVCEGRVVSCLEGGYNLETLGETVKQHVVELSAG